MEKALEFHGEKCCLFEKEDRDILRFLLEKIKRYDREYTAWYGDHVRFTLCQCPYCGAYFLWEEVEHTAWSDGDDFWTDNFYQVDSPEHADKLVGEEGLFINYKGPKMFA